MKCLMCHEEEMFGEGICKKCVFQMFEPTRECIFPNCGCSAMKHFSTCFKHFVETNQMYEMMIKHDNTCQVKGCQCVSLYGIGMCARHFIKLYENAMRDVHEDNDEIVFDINVIQINPPQPNIIVGVKIERREDFVKRCRCGILFDSRKGVKCDNCREKEMLRRVKWRFAIIPFVDTRGLQLNCAAIPQEYVDRIVARRICEDTSDKTNKCRDIKFRDKIEKQMRPKVKIYKNDKIDRYLRDTI